MPDPTLSRIMSQGFVTKDSGERVDYPSGMRRDVDTGKPRFDLIFPADVPFEEQLFVRVARLMARGAEKYGDRNWEKADSPEELERALGSAFRHFMDWFLGNNPEEDHGAAVVFNIEAVDRLRGILRRKGVAV